MFSGYGYDMDLICFNNHRFNIEYCLDNLLYNISILLPISTTKCYDLGPGK